MEPFKSFLKHSGFNFSPDSITWKILRERVLTATTLSVLLEQVVYLLVAAGVIQKSEFAKNYSAAAQRFYRTSDLTRALILGSPTDSRNAARTINTTHKQVMGSLHEDVGIYKKGTQFSAFDPQLIQWVWATFASKMIVGYERLIEPLADSEKDRFVAELSNIVVYLGGKADSFPKSYPALQAYISEMISTRTVEVTSVSIQIADHLLTLSSPVGRLSKPIPKMFAIGFINEELREQYGLSWSKAEEQFFSLTCKTVQRAVSNLPPRIRFALRD